MRAREFLKLIEQAAIAVPDQPAGEPVSDPISDLEYLIKNVNLSPASIQSISNALKNIAKTKEPTAVQPQQQPAQQPNVQPAQQPTIQSKAEIGDPMGQESEDEVDLQEVRTTPSEKLADLDVLVANLKAKAAAGTLTAQDIKQVEGITYTTKGNILKGLTDQILKKKFKFKSSPIYDLVRARTKALSTKVPFDIMHEFLEQCLESGVIDTVGMISGDVQGAAIPLLNPEFRTIADALLDLNLERLGKGEIGLAFMGIDAIKEATDITIAGIPIEVKASKGTDFFMKGNPDEGGFGNQTNAVKLLTATLNKVKSKDQGLYGFKSTNRSKLGGIAAIGATNINILNKYFMTMGRDATIDLLIRVLKELNKKLPEIVDNYSEEIAAAVSDDGAVDYQTLKLVTAKINFDYYKAMSHHEGILVLNLQSFQFVYATDPNVFAELVSSNVLQQMYALDFRTNGSGGIAYKMNTVGG